jgi:LmbE family N-acetylglucosaminyl deacetylase
MLARAHARIPRLDVHSLGGHTLVLAPHPDDETLGSGGLVALLRERGEPVDIVYVTDGATSHPSMARSELIECREREAAAAAEVLGVSRERLHFLRLPDGSLAHHVESASAQVAGILGDLRPARIVLPHALEPNDDHAATAAVAATAVAVHGRAVSSMSYFVWFWDQWPWTAPWAPPRSRHGRRRMLRTAWQGRLGTAIAPRLTHSIDVSAVLDRKRAALAMHRTQMTRPDGEPGWLTLADVANGEWLDLLLQPVELFAVGELRP